MSNIEADLNATIANAVNARIESEVFAALAGDEVIGRYVSNALRRPVEVPKDGGYGKERVPFLSHLLEQAFREATKAAVNKVLAEEQPLIEEEVRKAVKRNAGSIAEQLSASLAEQASRGYGVSIDVKLRGGDR